MRRDHWATHERVGRPGRPTGSVPEPFPAEEADNFSDLPAGLLEDLLPEVNPIAVAGTANTVVVSAGPAAAGADSAAAASRAALVRRIGLRLASLAARLYVDPHLPVSAFTPLVSWIDEHTPDSMGSTNHGADFPLAFGRCMGAHLQTCIALQHWQRLPALRIPSDFLRVIDGYTCLGEPLLVLVHVLTTRDGRVAYMTLDMSPNSANALQTARPGSRVASADTPCHRWKSGAAAAEHIALLESGVAVSLRDSLWRHAATAADGAYIGPHSNNIVRHHVDMLIKGLGSSMGDAVESALRTGDTAWQAACEFHGLQISGAEADAKFPQARAFDDVLRYLRQRFTFGAGRTVARGVAKVLGVKWRVPLAPRSDGFKVTAYSRHCAARYLYLFHVLHTSLQVELEAMYMYAKHEARKAYEKRLDHWTRLQSSSATADTSRMPRPPSPLVGLRLKQCCEIRATGRAMLCIRTLLFGLGRHELRDKFLSAYATLTQNYKISAMVKVAEQENMCMSMQAAVQGLLAASAALRLLHTFAWNRYRGTRGKVSRSALRLHIKVFCGHYAWRFVPMTVCAIPDLLLPLRGAAPSFQGVPLANPRFEEPSVRGTNEPSSYALEQGQDARWADVSSALRDLARWLRVEASRFRQRVLLWDSDEQTPLVLPPEFKSTSA